MNSLTELRDAFVKVGVEIKSFNGMFLFTEHGKWGMALGDYYLDGKIVPKKELKKMIGEK
jgi:hypothetical protein